MRGLTVAWIRRKLTKSGVKILKEHQIQQGNNGRSIQIFVVDAAFDSYEGYPIVYSETAYSQKAVYKKLYAKFKELEKTKNSSQLTSETETYRIPEEIKSTIKDDFYSVLLSECKKVFGDDLLKKDKFGTAHIDYIAGTGGFFIAFSNACEITGNKRLLDYWNGLEWYDSDMFESELCDIILERFR